jgi:hypothetical protein
MGAFLTTNPTSQTEMQIRKLQREVYSEVNKTSPNVPALLKKMMHHNPLTLEVSGGLAQLAFLLTVSLTVRHGAVSVLYRSIGKTLVLVSEQRIRTSSRSCFGGKSLSKSF